MKKVGIITLFDLNNYGNRLQNYATSIVYKKLGLEPLTIRIVRDSKFTPCKEWVKYIIGSIRKNRYAKFYKFSKKKIKYINMFSKSEVFPLNIEKKFDYFSTGSDQVWNSAYLGDCREIILKERLLAFTNPSKRLTMAPSFSLDDIPLIDKDLFRSELSKYNYIGVREKQGAEIVENLIGKTPTIMLDPTLLLSKEEWSEISVDSSFENKYVLTNFIVEPSILASDIIKSIECQKELKSINLYDLNSKYHSAGPSEFISLIKNSSCVCTDSFHTMVFAIIFEKPFIVFDRSDKKVSNDSRFSTLLENLKLANHMCHNKESFDLDSIFITNFKDTTDLLNNERKKTMDFLLKMISSK